MSSKPRIRRGLALWLSSTATPLFVLNRARRVVFFNAGCEALTEWMASDVIGQVCDFVSQPDHTQIECLTGVLCPPPEVWEGREQTVPAFVMTRSGARLSRLVRFFPLLGDNGEVERVLGLFSPLPPTKGASRLVLDHQLHAQLSALRADLKRTYDVSTLVGQSVRFQRLLQQVKLACRHLGSVHLYGEPGTGKEHLARLIHFQGEQRRRAFVPVDCQRLTRSELVETVKRVLREGRDAEPTRLSPGTLYLQHVDRLPDTLQEALIEEYSAGFHDSWPPADPEAGGDEDRKRQVRLMSSSTRRLADVVAEDVLNERLVELLTLQRIDVPPLRDRMEDLPLLAQSLLESLNRDQDHQIAGFADEVWADFRRYNWPGNIEELRLVIAEAREHCDQHTIRMADLPFRFRTGVDAQAVCPPKPVERVPLDERLASLEREFIQQALAEAGKNKSQAAQLLGLTRPKLYRRMEALGLAEADGNATDAEG